MNKIFTLSKIRNKIIFYTGITFISILLAIIILSVIRMQSSLIKLAEEELKLAVETAAYKIENENSIAVTTAKTLALTQVSGLFGKREESLELTKSVLKNSPFFTGCYFGYEPNADGNDKKYKSKVYEEGNAFDENGRFLPYWFRDISNEEILKLSPLIDMETSLYYNGVKEKFLSGSEEKYMVTEPYLYEGKMIVENAYPIIINNKFMGIAGVDLALTELDNFLNKLKPFKTSEFILFSRLGRVISSTYDKELKTKNLTDLPNFSFLNKFYASDKNLIVLDDEEATDYFYSSAKINTGNWTIVQRVDKSEILSPINDLIILVIIISIIGIIIAIVVISTIANSITKPIDTAVKASNDVAMGNFNVKISKVQKDETGQLLESIKIMAKNLRNLVSSINESSLNVKSTANRIELASNMQEEKIRNFSEFTNNIATSSEEITSTSKDLLNTMGNVSKTAINVSENADNKRKDIERMESKMSDLLEATKKISQRLTVLDKKATNINTVIDTINKVADQTNLLSLNAAIEAEKAGEYGQGFSVVATEIRRLSDQTSNATFDIEEMIKEMQTAVNAGVMEMDKFSDEVRKIVDSVNNTGHGLSETINEFKDIIPLFEIVLESMEAQSTGAEQIGESIINLNDNAKLAVDFLVEFSNASQSLNTAVNNLQSEISKFNINN